MHPLFTQALDRLIIRLAARAMPPAGRHEPHATEAAVLLQADDFFCDFVRVPELSFSGNNVFEFQSPLATPWENNNRVRGKLFRCAENWASHPTVILVHGWNDELGYRFRLPFCARVLNRHHINAALIELPYHLQRRPHAPGAIHDFISEDLWRMVEATRQSIADIRSLAKWLSEKGCGRIGLWGSSLGAWLGGLTLCHEPLIQIAVLTTPVVELERVIAELAFCAPIRRSYETANVSLEKMNLLSHRPRLSKAHLLIQEAEQDLFAPKESVEKLWRCWHEPEIWRLRHGHISILMSISVLRKTAAWFAKKFVE